MSEKWRIFIALICMQLAYIYVDLFNVLPHMDENEKYVFHFLAIYLTPLACSVGIILHLVEYIKGKK